MDRCKPEILLKTTKTKMTDARSRLLDILLDSGSPVSANELHKRLSKETTTDLATVYRALKVFTEKGLARASISTEIPCITKRRVSIILSTLTFIAKAVDMWNA